MKKIITFLFTIVYIFSLVGCNNGVENTYIEGANGAPLAPPAESGDEGTDELPHREDSSIENYLQSFPQESDEILSEGRAVCVMNNTFAQTHLWEAFLKQVKAGQEAFAVVMATTDEGDPILYYVHFDGTDYMVVTDTHRDHFGTPAYVKDKFKHMSEIRPEGTSIYQVVFANESLQTAEEANEYWEKTYALYEAGEIDPNGENEYQPFPLTIINTVWEQ